jgi:hypothetical protein
MPIERCVARTNPQSEHTSASTKRVWSGGTRRSGIHGLETKLRGINSVQANLMVVDNVRWQIWSKESRLADVAFGKGKNFKSQAQCPENVRASEMKNVKGSEEQLIDYIEYCDKGTFHVNGCVSHDKKSAPRTGACVRETRLRRRKPQGMSGLK